MVQTALTAIVVRRYGSMPWFRAHTICFRREMFEDLILQYVSRRLAVALAVSWEMLCVLPCSLGSCLPEYATVLHCTLDGGPIKDVNWQLVLQVMKTLL